MIAPSKQGMSEAGHRDVCVMTAITVIRHPWRPGSLSPRSPGHPPSPRTVLMLVIGVITLTGVFWCRRRTHQMARESIAGICLAIPGFLVVSIVGDRMIGCSILLPHRRTQAGGRSGAGAPGRQKKRCNLSCRGHRDIIVRWNASPKFRSLRRTRRPSQYASPTASLSTSPTSTRLFHR